jgi:NAD(P)-dependent dehydrogenase (short-subunit alcohol dehydrogenase family)
MKGMDKKIAIVTGGGTGIGEAIARRFAKSGASVVVAGRRLKLIESVAAEIGGLAVQVDVTSLGDCKNLVRRTVEDLGPPDILVSNAAILTWGTVTDQTLETWATTINVNLTGAMQICREVIPVMVEHGGGSIVLISSTGGITASPSEAAYTSSKFGILGLTRSIALDYGRKGIRANCVCPGWVQTPMTDYQIPDHAMKWGIKSEEVSARWSKYLPLGRIGKPDEIAACVEFLASDEAAYVTGATLVADGGGLAVDVASASFFEGFGFFDE